MIDTLDRLRTIIADLEAERHGYLLTLDPAYLKAYGVSDESVRREAEALQALVASDPLQSFRAGHLALIISAKLREIDDIVKTAARVSGHGGAGDDPRHGRYPIANRPDCRTMSASCSWIGRSAPTNSNSAGRGSPPRPSSLSSSSREWRWRSRGSRRSGAERRPRRTSSSTAISQERDRKIRRLVDSNIIGIIIWELEGRILEANDAFLRIVGYDREDLAAGRLNRTMLTPPEWHDLDARNVAELKQIGTIPPFEKEYFRKDGSRVPVLIGGAMFEESQPRCRLSSSI